MLASDKRQLDRRVLHEAASLARNGYLVDIASLGSNVCMPTNLPPDVSISDFSGGESRAKGNIEEFLRKHVPRALQELFYFRITDPALRMARRFGPLIKKDWDILVAHDLPLLPLAFDLRERQGLGKVVLDAHELFDEQHDSLVTETARKYWRDIERQGLPMCDGIMTVSQRIAEELKRRRDLAAMPTVILNACPFRETFKNKQALHQLYGIDERRKIVLCQGGILPNRSLEDFVKAWKSMDEPRPALVFLGFGIKNLMNKLDRMIIDLGLEKDVFLGKAVPPDEILDYTHSASLGLISNRGLGINNTDGAPNRLFEYIQARVPVLSYEHRGVESILYETGTGWVVGWNSPEHLTGIIHKALADAEQMPQERLEDAARKFSWENEEPKLLALVDGLGEAG
jgi:glycosyltransferase involved in cell wall biosynthesis